MRIGRIGNRLREITITVKKTPIKKVNAKLAFKGPRLVKVRVETKKIKKNRIDFRV